jgi:hypothetical protein
VLPDAELGRFSLDDAGRVWLVDLWSAAESAPEPAVVAHTGLAKGACRALLGSVPEEARDFAELAACIERFASTSGS